MGHTAETANDPIHKMLQCNAEWQKVVIIAALQGAGGGWRRTTAFELSKRKRGKRI